MRVGFRWLAAAVLGIAMIAMAGPSRADEIFTGSSGNLSAKADFNLTGTTLTVTFTNTSSTVVTLQNEVLTDLLFHNNGNGTLTVGNATLPAGTLQDGSTTDSNPANGWGYGTTSTSNTAGSPAVSFNNTIASAGNAGIGHANFGPTTNGSQLDGVSYGIVGTAGIDTSGHTSDLANKGPLYQNSVQFTLTTALGFKLSDLGNEVGFVYGTSGDEARFLGHMSGSPPPTPEPGAMTLLVLGMASVGGCGWWRKKKAAV
jgi:hypothetical protein